jgi:hypothetical protein
MEPSQEFNIARWVRSRTGLVLIAFLAIASFFLITEHTTHVLGILPYALLLLCPLLHLFMHSGHGDHDAPDDRAAHQHPEDRK